MSEAGHHCIISTQTKKHNIISIPGGLYILHYDLRIQRDNMCKVLRIFSRHLEMELRIGIRVVV